MTSEDKIRLAHTHDLGVSACAIRLRAARALTGLKQKELAEKLPWLSTTNLNNMENGTSFPNRQIMEYYYREHRVDFNFLIGGLYAQLPGDVQEQLFVALEAANSEWDRKQHSGRNRV